MAVRIAVVASACLTAAAGAQAPRVRDSSGVRVIQNTAPDLASRPSIRIAERPTLQIGAQEGAFNLLFNGVAGATRQSDGSVVIADRSSGEIRIFDSAGRFARKFGGKGGGPGEFRSLAQVWAMRGDSIGAWDAAVGRLTVFDAAGRVGRTLQPQAVSPASTGSIGRVPGVMNDGTFFGYRIARSAPPIRKAITRDTLVVARYRADGTYLGEVGRFLGLETIREVGGSMPSPTGGTRVGFSIEGVPFARETVLRAGGSWLYAGDGGVSYEILGYDASGKLRRIIRATKQPRPMTPSIIARYLREQGDPGTPSRPGVNPKMDEAFYPKTIPAFDAIQVDKADRLWVGEPRLPGQTQRVWHVYDRDGTLLGTLPTPVGVEVLEIGTTYLLGVWRDDVGVEYVRLYALSRER